MKDGKALYRGLSLFDTIKNAYSGNVLCSEADKVEMMKPLISEAQLAGIQTAHHRGNGAGAEGYLQWSVRR